MEWNTEFRSKAKHCIASGAFENEFVTDRLSSVQIVTRRNTSIPNAFYLWQKDILLHMFTPVITILTPKGGYCHSHVRITFSKFILDALTPVTLARFPDERDKTC